MKILAFDSSGLVASVAILEEEQLIAEILEIYDSSEDQVKTDINEFLTQLKSLQMVKEI